MEFQTENIDFDYAEVTLVFAEDNVNNKVVIRDLTYDDAINFQTLIKTEQEFLNLEPNGDVIKYPLKATFPAVGNPTKLYLDQSNGKVYQWIANSYIELEGNYGAEFNNTQIALGTNFGQWTFGEDTFGNKITIVKTEKLSGKGYNIKTIFTDFTKAKWTLETMGIAYKMRRTRSV